MKRRIDWKRVRWTIALPCIGVASFYFIHWILSFAQGDARKEAFDYILSLLAAVAFPLFIYTVVNYWREILGDIIKFFYHNGGVKDND